MEKESLGRESDNLSSNADFVVDEWHDLARTG